MLIGSASILASAVAAWAGSSSWTGYLIDRPCARSYRDDPGALDYVRHHTRNCALMAPCRTAGYVLFAGGAWYDLDRKGNELSVQTIKASSRSRGFFVTVSGELVGKTIRVKEMKEVAEPSGQRPQSRGHLLLEPSWSKSAIWADPKWQCG